MYKKCYVMNRLATLLLVLIASASLHAQSLTPYTEYKIKEGITVQIEDIHRVEKYGWDNLEVVYVLKNETNFDVRKLDFMIHLLDENQKEIGTIVAHATEVPKHSQKTMKFVDIGSDFVNEKITTSIPETTSIDVIIENQESQVVSIKGSNSIYLK